MTTLSGPELDAFCIDNTMPECNNCGEHVSDRFIRVFGDEAGVVYACPACSANAGIGEATRERSDQI
ncbi:hypothetical protein D8Y22_11975 [Salinadaptatus halalkaliphilus]|uniref:Small CPxCG-related zinc finger protein n=1 Tax=Salinadaptatus halalkaliphilus TaxID=2419781 RepID=A0A4S3TNE4_9EURY|nr:hypothetical protein D8Y22_11975 [Salinadaptatus halalkaliphilus]